MSKEKKSADSTIVTAIITGIVTIAVTAITVLGSQLLNKSDPTATPDPTASPFPTWTNVPAATMADTPEPTDAVAFGEASSTPAPATPTTEPTFTPLPRDIGEDWVNNCISVRWIPYPNVDPTGKDGCFSQPVSNFFFAENGRLTFLVDGRFDNTVYGIFAPLPTTGSADIKVYLKDLKNGEIWMGIFAEPTIDNSKGMIMVIPPGDVTNRLLKQKSMPGQVEAQSTAFFSHNPPIYHLRFDFTSGTVKATVEPNAFVTNPISFPSAQKYLFIGYQLKNGNNRIDAEFLDLVIQSK